MVSQDAAESFTNHNYSSDDLNSVFFVDENIGYVVGDNGTIGKSINGGLDWTAQTSSVTTNLNSVVFTSADNGVACGDNGVVIYTNNGGATWSAYTTSVTSDLLKIDMKGNTLIATGADAFVLKYNGTAWTMIDYNIVNKAEVTGIKMIDENTFYTCGGGGFIRKSVDGGATFEFQKNPMMQWFQICIFLMRIKDGL